MKEEDLKLIKKDFSARIPHGVKFITWKEGYEGSGISIIVGDAIGIVDDMIVTKNGSYDIRNCRAYLRKLSSMTEEENEEYTKRNLFGTHWDFVDWCNEKGLDYRGLIEKHLAIELTEENLLI